MTCYACGKPAVGKCKAPGCTHEYCAHHGKVVCLECQSRFSKDKSGSPTVDPVEVAASGCGCLFELIGGIIRAILGGL